MQHTTLRKRYEYMDHKMEAALTHPGWAPKKVAVLPDSWSTGFRWLEERR